MVHGRLVQQEKQYIPRKPKKKAFISLKEAAYLSFERPALRLL